MSSALNILRRILEEGGPRARKAERTIGDAFYDAAESVDDMFQRGRQYELYPEGLERQFGVKFGEPYASSDNFFTTTEVTAPGASGPAFITRYNTTDPAEIARLMSHPLEGAAMPREGIVPVEYGTTNFRAKGRDVGGGAGRAGYAAMFGALRQDPAMLNFTSGLTSSNQHRRSYNQAAALLRDPALARQIMVDPGQLKVRPRSERDPAKFLYRPAEEQVGALQAEGALNLLRRLERVYDDPDLFPGARRSVGRMFDLIDRGDDPAAFESAARTLRMTGGDAKTYGTIGPAALKRAALVSDLVYGRGTDLRRHLFSGLEYRAGGPVRRRGTPPR